MRIHLLAAGARQPAWINAGYEEFAQRLPPECRLQLHEIPLSAARKRNDVARAIRDEGQGILAALPDRASVIALDVSGRSFTSESLARQLNHWLQDGRDLALMIGGPDGLSQECLQRAELKWSLSALTLPHGLVRVLVAEQLYRAWTILQGHPYHRD